MKVAILVLALVALTASVAYAAPVEETKFEAMLQALLGSQQTEDDSADETLLEKLSQQETASEQDKQSIVAQDEDEQIDAAALQEFFAEQQVPAELQKWSRTIIKNYRNYLMRNRANIIRRGIRAGIRCGLKSIYSKSTFRG